MCKHYDTLNIVIILYKILYKWKIENIGKSS